MFFFFFFLLDMEKLLSTLTSAFDERPYFLVPELRKEPRSTPRENKTVKRGTKPTQAPSWQRDETRRDERRGEGGTGGRGRAFASIAAPLWEGAGRFRS